MKHFLVSATLVASVLIAHGELYSFSAITANDPLGAAQLTGESQLLLEVSPTGTGQASLVFSNTGPAPSVISQIYFDFIPDLKLEITTINNGDGVEFDLNHRTSGNLPSGHGLDVPFLSDLSVTAQSPKPVKGINPCENLELMMDYDSSYDLTELLLTEELRIGLHVQSFTGGYSESFINKTTHQEAIPEPGTLPILFSGAFVLRWFRQR